ncbi:putative xyloglucan endotransglucosylase/hydrolase protein 30 [Silene latifolia]|uniref:putative xyloglucan endotransglucosylase/hydrolase protein 30 n=1 Tax=Silene latifolia TaxID=37657 RepID=UPI003D777682
MKIMAIYVELIIIICSLIASSNCCPGNLTTTTFNEGFMKLGGNVSVSGNRNSVNTSLLNNTGASGFASQVSYTEGLFSAYIKLPSQNYTAGIVVTFYLSNNLHEHDEIDFEFLGHAHTGEWILQTNFYGNGSSGQGREERYKLWFDPGKEAHKYSIFWTENKILYYIDELPIRSVQKVDVTGVVYPSKPMTLYATIWDGSDWATDGGRSKANFTYEPFVVEYSDFVLNGCWIDPSRNFSVCGSDYSTGCGNMTSRQLKAYTEFRKKYLTYSYCLDKNRYNNTTLPECDVLPGSGMLQ